MRFLVTAGNTREPIDRVRDWGNIFTGNTGYAIAKALAGLGEVDLLTSNRPHLLELAGTQDTEFRITGSPFRTHADLRGALEALIPRTSYHAIFMTAAVSDYAPAGAYAVERREVSGDMERWTVRNVQAGKIKSNHGAIAILGEQTEKLVDLIRKNWSYKGLLVKFKLEVGLNAEEVLRIAQSSRKASDADYLVANTLDMVEGQDAGAYLVGDFGHEWVPRGNLAGRLADLVRPR